MSETTEPLLLAERAPGERMAYLEGVRIAYRIAADSLNLSPSEIRMHAGEIDPQAMRDVQAVLGWRARTLRSMADAV